ncbi:hypothetical protein [Pelomonas sp. SE-A7]|uniref:hypothetical protein n=1 Tax=Pelomonas sp. SE-A7 TaxID=3054953 RepID=UPI00259CE4E3|nr:hypothetical protein [Pelomonas sp. SE-A7]MDM4765492.1 hypothetical protein [Pelomonas sp. SE-A7]
MKQTLSRLARLGLMAGVALASLAQAAGPLYTTDKPGNPQPLRWNTSKPIPVYTDLGVYAYDVDGKTPFITNQRAREMVAFAVNEWSKVPTSTWKGYIAGDFSQVPSIGADVTAANVEKVYGQYNGGGMHVIYDTDGGILENYFGLPKDAVLGIAFPEIAEDTDGDGYEDTIVEATALMNGYAVDINDKDGSKFTGIMTHEFGHALNLSHTQVNGQMAYFSIPGYYDLYAGVPGCGNATAYHRIGFGGNDMPAQYVETMFPFIDPSADIGYQMSTVNMPDDIAGISNLYPTANYRSSTGSIAGTLYLKDGRTPYAGVNVIARNVSNPLADAVSAMTGDQTQGKVGPDGRYQINNLKAGQKYVLYMEEIVAGGYPTEPRALVSEAEYWNSAEGASPANDKACDATAITAQAGKTAKADLVFNGYADGVDYYPLINANLTKLSRNGSRASGVSWSTQFIWDARTGIEVLPANIFASNGGMDANGLSFLVNADTDGNGISSAAIYAFGKTINLGSLNKDKCGGDSIFGPASSYGFALDDWGLTAVGLAYVDSDGDGFCQSGFLPEIRPFIWKPIGGMRQLDIAGHNYNTEGWLRAQNVSGDGTVVLGETNYQKAMAWVNEGKRIDLFAKYGGINAYAVNKDGTRVAMDSVKKIKRTAEDGTVYDDYLSNGAIVWNPKANKEKDALTKLPQMRWCTDLALPAYIDWFGQLVDPCANGAAAVQADYGFVPMQINDMSDDGRIMVGRAGSFITNTFEGVMYVEGIGWIKMGEFFRKQGVAEAYRYGMQNPVSLNAAGNEMIGGLLFVEATWYVDMKEVYVCENRRSQKTSFPDGFIQKVRGGAKMGRCEHQ